MKVTLKKDKDTKNTIRYSADQEHATEPLPFDSLYVTKWALNQLGDGKAPESIEVEIRVPA